MLAVYWKIVLLLYCHKYRTFDYNNNYDLLMVYVSVGKIVVLSLLITLVAAECPCVHCGPPMCRAVCLQDCVKCCECCVFFENRVGKRSASKEDKQESLCLYKRHLSSPPPGEIQPPTGSSRFPLEGDSDIAEELSLRLSILRATNRLTKNEGLNNFLAFLQQAADRSHETWLWCHMIAFS